ncbi:MAG: hypothetical protein KAQ93_08060 [Spirochaetales bacterium]|nr:hypothetical protein [Spirochaetales bacterium]
MARRFYFYKRNQIYYVKYRNPFTGKLLPGKSTGTVDQEKASYIAHKWLYEGIPERRTRTPRKPEQIFTVYEILEKLKHTELTVNDAKRFTDYFKSIGLIKDAQIINDEKTESLISFLLNSWDYQNSSYVKEKLAHGQSIGRRRCLDATGAVKRYCFLKCWKW